jgi:hypothetical protein
LVVKLLGPTGLLDQGLVIVNALEAYELDNTHSLVAIPGAFLTGWVNDAAMWHGVSGSGGWWMSNG